MVERQVAGEGGRRSDRVERGIDREGARWNSIRETAIAHGDRLVITLHVPPSSRRGRTRRIDEVAIQRPIGRGSGVRDLDGLSIGRVLILHKHSIVSQLVIEGCYTQAAAILRIAGVGIHERITCRMGRNVRIEIVDRLRCVIGVLIGP